MSESVLRSRVQTRRPPLVREQNFDITIMLIIGVVTRMLLQTNLLNMFYNYGQAGGNPLLKISPGSYIIFITWMISLTRSGGTMLYDFKMPFRLMLLIVVVGLGWAIFTAKTLALGYLIDCYLSTAACIYVMGKIGPLGRQRLFDAILLTLVFNEMVLFAEFALKRRFIVAPDNIAAEFRPAALFNHPLLSGLIYATATSLVFLSRWPLSVRTGLSLAFVTAAFASGARVSSVLAAGAFVLSFPIAIQRTETGGNMVRQRWVTTQILAVLMLIPIGIIVGMGAGLGDRLSHGFVDKSSATRVIQYGLLAYLTPSQMMTGVGDLIATEWSTRLYQTPSIESSIVLGIFMYGLPYTIFYLLVVVATLLIFAWRGDNLVKISVFVFLAAALSNNTLMSKNPAVLFVLVAAGATLTMPLSRRSPPIGISALRILMATRRTLGGAAVRPGGPVRRPVMASVRKPAPRPGPRPF